jgi:hypothetical protein
MGVGAPLRKDIKWETFERALSRTAARAPPRFTLCQSRLTIFMILKEKPFKFVHRRKACEKTDHLQTTIDAISISRTSLSRECRMAVAARKIPVKDAEFIEKEFSTAVLGDLFDGVSFLRFLGHFWGRWRTGAHGAPCSKTWHIISGYHQAIVWAKRSRRSSI